MVHSTDKINIFDRPEVFYYYSCCDKQHHQVRVLYVCSLYAGCTYYMDIPYSRGSMPMSTSYYYTLIRDVIGVA
jgi:hypothetical protein